MFLDRVTLHCKAGDGGNGCMSFRREKYEPRGGPDGGDGGRGGDVIVRADENMGSLVHLVGHKHWHGGRGGHGEGSLRTGKAGEDAVILVPPGTIVRDAGCMRRGAPIQGRDAIRGHVIRDLTRAGDSVIVAHGGKAGKGNKRFATATNQAPREHEEGTPGEERTIALELKIIADVGLIGKPNAGKSTLLSRLSRANPEIADYPFTTKYPNLGMVRVGYDRQFVVADIPGLIEGAHAGVGLGHEFLKHVERTRVLVHLVEPSPLDGSDPTENYRTIREELALYDPALLQRPEIICVTKCELPDAAAAAELLADETGRPVVQISAVTGKGLPELITAILRELQPEP